MSDVLNHYLVIRSSCQHSVFAGVAERARSAGESWRVVLATPVHRVAAVEPGSMPAHLLLIETPPDSTPEIAWHWLEAQGLARNLAQLAPPLVLAVAGIPAAGLGPDVPTPLNTAASTDYPTYLVIEGTAHDAARMERYRDILLPMMFERAACYVAFELGGSVRVLSGEWDEAIFAISRWPQRRLAEDFWLSARYQDEAIPLRIDVGRFSVLMVEATA